MALRLRSALKAALGASLAVTHTGPDSVTRVITVPVLDQGTAAGEEQPLPVVHFVGEFGNSESADIGAAAAHNEAYVDIHILVTESPDGTWDAPRLLEDIYAALESAVRAAQRIVGSSYFTLATHYRDFPPRQTEAGPYWFVRYVMVRGENLETY